MKLIRRSEAHTDARPDGRIVRTLFSAKLPLSDPSIVFYLCDVPKGKFGEHCHSVSHEFIWFPVGGAINVNGETHHMEPWDGVLLEPGDRHGYAGANCPDIVHFAVKLPDRDDKVES